MKTCILYHSESGTTKSFALKIQKQLELKGHSVDCVQLQSKAPIQRKSVRDQQQIEFIALPDPANYELMIFGGPVWAFGPSPAIVQAIRQLKPTGKKCACFVTMGLPFRWMGGKAAISYMERVVKKSAASSIASTIYSRFNKDPDAKMNDLAGKFVADL